MTTPQTASENGPVVSTISVGAPCEDVEYTAREMGSGPLGTCRRILGALERQNRVRSYERACALECSSLAHAEKELRIAQRRAVL